MDAKPNRREMGLCYAFSTDGIHWEKPELGLIEFNGSKQNNIAMRRVNGAGVFKDAREIDPTRRYKMFFCGEPQMTVAFSPDGLHWVEPIRTSVTNAQVEWDTRQSLANFKWKPNSA